jgi:hypothetical protein
VYLSLLNHPLDDATPIAFETAETQLINTTIDIVYASSSIPFVVLHDRLANEIRFCLLKRINEGADGEKSKESALQSID